MLLGYKIVFLFLTVRCAYGGNIPTNIIGINNIIDIPNKISGITGLGSKGNDTSGDNNGGTTTVMGTNYGAVIPGFAQNIFGMNKTESDNNTSSGSYSNGGGIFGSIAGIPNKVFPNKTGLGGNIPGYGYISGIPNQIFGNNKTSSDNSSNSNPGGLPNFGPIVTGFPDKIFGNNKTSANGTDSNSGWPDFGSVIPGIFGNSSKTNETTQGNNSGNGSGGGNETNTEGGSNGLPDFSSYIPGLSNKKNKSCGSQSTGGISSYYNYIPGLPNIFGTNSSDSKNYTSTGIDLSPITNIPDKIWGHEKENSTRKRRHCSHCQHNQSSEDQGDEQEEGHGHKHGMEHGHGHGMEHGKEHAHDESSSKKKRQIGSNLGSIIPGGSNLGSLGSSLGDSGDATLYLGMFQILEKPIKTPSIDGMTGIIKNPQSIITQPQNLLNGGKIDRPPSEYVVTGAFAVLLRASACAGVCPLRFKRVQNGWLPTVSAPLAVLQRLVMTVSNVIMLAAVIMDFYQEPEKRIRVGETTLKAFVWISDMVLVMMIASVAVYLGPSRMKNLIQVLNQLHQISLDLKINAPSEKSEKIKSIVVICIIMWGVMILIADFHSFLLVSIHEDRMWSIMCMYCTYYIANLQGLMVELQWCGAVLAVHAAAAALNDQLTQLRHVPATGPSPAQATIRHLALSYESISDLTRQMNATNGTFLMTVLMSTFLRLVLTPYYLLLRFEDDERVVHETLLQINWSLFHMAVLLMTIEPCHWTQEQRERTQILLSQLIVHVAPKCERLSMELDQFAKQILLSSAKFMPLGVYALARPLMATILGGVATYLVIIIQFQKISDQL